VYILFYSHKVFKSKHSLQFLHIFPIQNNKQNYILLKTYFRSLYNVTLILNLLFFQTKLLLLLLLLLLVLLLLLLLLLLSIHLFLKYRIIPIKQYAQPYTYKNLYPLLQGLWSTQIKVRCMRVNQSF
jgi:hypothetical protein